MLRRPHAPRGDRGPLPFGIGIVVAAALVGAPLAVAATGDALREGVRNGTAVEETRIVGDVDATPTGRGGFVLRAANVATGRDAGGASLMSCSAPRGGTARGSAPCLRTDNRAGGSAFEFSSKGALGGAITLGDPAVPSSGKPFVTNATGVASRAERRQGRRQGRGRPGRRARSRGAGGTGRARRTRRTARRRRPARRGVRRAPPDRAVRDLR